MKIGVSSVVDERIYGSRVELITWSDLDEGDPIYLSVEIVDDTSSCEACDRPWVGVLGRVRLHLCERHLNALGYGSMILSSYTPDGPAPEPPIEEKP